MIASYLVPVPSGWWNITSLTLTPPSPSPSDPLLFLFLLILPLLLFFFVFLLFLLLFLIRRLTILLLFGPKTIKRWYPSRSNFLHSRVSRELYKTLKFSLQLLIIFFFNNRKTNLMAGEISPLSPYSPLSWVRLAQGQTAWLRVRLASSVSDWLAQGHTAWLIGKVR